jgi:hypothetical protein
MLEVKLKIKLSKDMCLNLDELHTYNVFYYFCDCNISIVLLTLLIRGYIYLMIE